MSFNGIMCIIRQISQGPVIMLKHWGFCILKMNTTLFQIYLKFIWPKRQELYRQII
jgi:hypothetical protein